MWINVMFNRSAISNYILAQLIGLIIWVFMLLTE